MPYTPISELPKHADAEHPFAWDVVLPPHIDAERLEVNTTRLHRFGRIAGLHGISIGQYDGPVTTYEAPAIGGLFNDGTAAGAGTAKEHKARRVEVQLESSDPEIPNHYCTSFARIHINRPEMIRRIAAETGKGRDDHKVWAEELDGALSKGLRSGINLNAYDSGPYYRLLAGAGGGMLITSLIQQVPPTFAVGLAVHGAYLYTERDVLKTHFKERRWSFMPGGVLTDRIIAGFLYTTLPFIRARNKKPQERES